MQQARRLNHAMVAAVLLTATTASYAQTSPYKKIFLNPSDQTWNLVTGGGTEAEYARLIAARVQTHLISAGHSVKLHYSRPDAPKRAREWSADYFVSIHSNAGRSHGIETLFGVTPTSEEFALTIKTALLDGYGNQEGFPDRRVINGVNIADVLAFTTMPAVLAETMFHDCTTVHTSTSESAFLRSEDGQKRVALALAHGICSEFGEDCGCAISAGEGSSDAEVFADAFERWGGRLGCPAEAGGGPNVHDVFGVSLQDFYQPSAEWHFDGSDGRTALAYGGSGDSASASLLRSGFWAAYKCLVAPSGGGMGGAHYLGAPLSEEYRRGQGGERSDPLDHGNLLCPNGHTCQDFEHGHMWFGNETPSPSVHIHVTGVTEQDGDRSTCVQPPPGIRQDCLDPGLNLRFCDNPPFGPVCGDESCDADSESYSSCAADCFYTSALPSQTPNGVSRMCPGETTFFTLEYENTGTLPWIDTDDGVSGPAYVELRSVNPSGSDEVDSPLFPGSPWINPQRVGPPLDSNVEPGAFATFNVPVLVPADAVPGEEIAAYFRPYSAEMDQSGDGFFEDWGEAHFTVQVRDCTPAGTTCAALPAETCNGIDDNQNTVIDDLESCWVPVYRFWDTSMASNITVGMSMEDSLNVLACIALRKP